MEFLFFKIKKTITLFTFLILANLPLPCQSQLSISQNHPDLKWQKFETKHFQIIYHLGIEELAQRVAELAESVYVPITSDLGAEPPGKTSIIVSDYLDYSNGLATPLGHYFVIWATSENKYMTGDIKWLRAVVSHEFTHIVNFWAFRAFPGFWRELLALGFIPTWFLEGLAEYEAEKWCAHRDMLLRVVAYHQKMLPYKKMTGFIGTDQIGSRLVYEQGHSLIRYIAYQFGPEKIREIIKKYRSFPFSFNLALKRAIGLSEKELFAAWKNEVESHYNRVYKNHRQTVNSRQAFKTPLQAVHGVRWSPNEKKIAIVGIKEYDEGVTDLYLYNIKSQKITKVAGPYVSGFFSWSPDGRSIVYSQQHIVRDGSTINDLFLLDTGTLRIKKLTEHGRATDPHFSPDGDQIVYTVHQGSRSNLAVLNLTTGDTKNITEFPAWTEVFTPHWSPDGTQIAFSIWDAEGRRDICAVKPDGSDLLRLTNTADDDRYPVWSPDGSQFAFISYRTGIPNLYLTEIKTQKTCQLTDTPGGVFNPVWLPDAKRIAVIAFENRDSTEIAIVPVNKSSEFPTVTPAIDRLPFHASQAPATDNFSIAQSFENFQHQTRRYFSTASIRPQIVLPYADKSEANWQPGLINLSADPLGKHSLMTALTYRNRLHFFVDYTNRQLGPTIQFQVNKTTLDHGDFITLVNEKNQTTTVLPLYENFWSGALTCYWNINFGNSLLSNHLFWLRTTFTYRDIINTEDGYNKINTTDWVYPLLQGWTNYLSLGYSWQTYRPDLAYDIHPKSGWWFTIYGHHGDNWLGSELKFSQLGLTGVFRRELPIREHVIAIRAGVSFRRGTQPVQSRSALGENAIRGISCSAEGDQQLFTNIEYRFPLVRDLGLKIWILYFERFTAALFLDSGKAWGNDLVKLDQTRWQSFSSNPWLQTTGLELRHRFYLLGKIPIVVSGGFAFETSSLDKSNYYFRIGPVY